MFVSLVNRGELSRLCKKKCWVDVIPVKSEMHHTEGWQQRMNKTFKVSLRKHGTLAFLFEEIAMLSLLLVCK